MAITFRSSTQVTTGTRTNTTVTAPAGAANGSDVIVVAINAGASSSVTIAAPGGWTTVSSLAYGDAGWTVNMYLFLRVHDGSANWTFTHSSAASDASAVAWQGVDTTTPSDTTAQTVTGSSTSNIANVASITINTAGAQQLLVRGSWDGDAITPPAGWTERKDTPIMWVGDLAAAGTGATGTFTMSAGNGGGTNPYGTVHAALRPSGGTSVSDPGRIKKLNYGALLQL